MRGSIVVVAKCPIPGKSKTRLIPRLGEEGSALVARAMLADVLSALTNCNLLGHVSKILLYAPGNDDGCYQMKEILNSLDLQENWILLPVATTNMKSSDIGSMLSDALRQTRAIAETNNEHSIVFLGMDAPELALEEIVAGLLLKDKALLCPANDGGYGMLCVPPNAPPTIFDNIEWSNTLTGLSQLKALSDHGIETVLGKMMHDVDEPQDLNDLAERLCAARNAQNQRQVVQTKVLLSRSKASLPVKVEPCSCDYTWEAMLDVGVVSKSKSQGTGSDIFVVSQKNQEQPENR